MITETLLNSLKSLFSSLGAKTSDSNYAVGLFDKTNGEPKGMMGMSDLASVLGAFTFKGVLPSGIDSCKTTGWYENNGDLYLIFQHGERCFQIRAILSAGVISTFAIRGWILSNQAWGQWNEFKFN